MRLHPAGANSSTRHPMRRVVTSKVRNALHMLALGLLAVVVAACGSGDPAAPRDPSPTAVPTFVGAIADSDALIAVLVDGAWMTVYTCGGEDSWETHTGWFYGRPEGSSFDLEYGGLQVEGHFGEDRAWGTLTLVDGTALEFDAPRAEPDTAAGIYHHHAPGDRTGLIVTNELSATGVRYRYDAGESAPVSVEDELRREATESVTVSSMGDSFTVTRLRRSVEDPPAPDPDPETSGRVEIISDDAVLLSRAGDEFRLEAVVYDDEGRSDPGAHVRWSSSNPDQVEVDDSGLVVAQEDVGYAIVQAASEGAEPAQASILVATLAPGVTYVHRSDVIDMDLDALTVGLRPTEEAAALRVGEIVASNAGFAGHILEIDELADRIEVAIEIASIAETFERLEVSHVGETLRFDRTPETADRATSRHGHTFEPLSLPSFTCEAGASILAYDFTAFAVESEVIPTASIAVDGDGTTTFSVGFGGTIAFTSAILSLLIDAGGKLDCYARLSSLPVNLNLIVAEFGPTVRPIVGWKAGASLFEGPSVTFNGPALTLGLSYTAGVVISSDGTTSTPFTANDGPALSVDAFESFGFDPAIGEGLRFELETGPYVGLEMGIGVTILGQPLPLGHVNLARPRISNDLGLSVPIASGQPNRAGYGGPSWTTTLGGTMEYGVLDVSGIDPSKTLKALGIKATIAALKIDFFEYEWAASPTPTIDVLGDSFVFGDDVQLTSTVPNDPVNSALYEGRPVEFWAFSANPQDDEVGVPIAATTLTAGAAADPLTASTTWTVDLPPGNDYAIRAMLDGSVFGLLNRPYASSLSDPVSVGRSISISPATAEVPAEEWLEFTVALLGEDADTVGLEWSASGGSFIGDGASVSWSSELAGDYQITACIAVDPEVCATAHVEVFATIELTPQTVVLETDESATFSATVRGFEDDSVTWHATAGQLDEGATEAIYTAPDVAGIFWITAKSAQDSDLRAFAEIRVDEISMLPYVSISNVSLDPHPRFDDQFVMRFDAEWSNSWFEDKRPVFVASDSGWDALWVFAKYSFDGREWHHVRLSSDQFGLNRPDNAEVRIAPYDEDPSAGPGAFVDRAVRADDDGVFRVHEVELGWDDQEPSVVAGQVSFTLFAIEMAYVPTEAFVAGGVGAEANAFEETTIEDRGSPPAGYAIEPDASHTFRSLLPFVPVHQLGWEDVAAFAAWAGLRPITELEYEKATRGPLDPIGLEFAWGSTDLVPAEGISDPGTLAEAAGNSGANAVVGDVIGGPLRAGSLAQAGDSREGAGAGYYGALALSGSTWERVVRLLPDDNVFSGRHGEGTLSAEGRADVAGWPRAGDRATILRGGSWRTGEAALMLADRSGDDDGERHVDAGWRGGRTGP